MKRQIIFSFFLILVFATLVLYQNCSNVKLERNNKSSYGEAQIGVDLCTVPSSQIISNLKFIFAIDRSGSNQKRYDALGNILPGTDPDGTRRFVPIENFLSNFAQSANIFYSLVNFGSNASVTQKFTNDKNAFGNLILDQHARTQQIDNDGWTNYLGALSAVQKLINDDIAAAAAATPIISSNYVIFFISDGAPIMDTGMQDTNLIIKQVQTIAALKNQQPELVDGVQLNTGFYYSDAQPDQVAQTLLQQMSTTGFGVGLEFGAGQAIDFNKFTIPTRIQKFQLREFWVQNLSTVWWGSQLMYDSDMDGIPDDIELQMGSDPNNADSDGNGVRDGVEYKLTGKACKDLKCSGALADPYLKCASLKKTVTNNVITYLDSDKDGLNDCEESLLGSDPNQFDTNLDYIPDGLAYAAGIDFLRNSNNSQVDSDQDGVNNYYELKYNTPASVPNSSVPGMIKLQVQQSQTSDNSSQTCYHFDINQFAIVAPLTKTNRIRLYEIESTDIIGTKKIMRVAEKDIVANGAVGFTTQDFK